MDSKNDLRSSERMKSNIEINWLLFYTAISMPKFPGDNSGRATGQSPPQPGKIFREKTKPAQTQIRFKIVEQSRSYLLIFSAAGDSK